MEIIGSPKFFPAVLILLDVGAAVMYLQKREKGLAKGHLLACGGGAKCGGDVLADGRTRKGGEKTEICQSVYRKNTE